MVTRNTAAARGKQDALAMLKADHARVKQLVEQFDKASGDDRKQKIAERICQELEVHAQLEEEVFYPAVRAAIKDDDMMDEAQVEHDSAKDLIRQIRSMSPGQPLYDAKVTVLGEYVEHHVEEEEKEMFRKAKRAKVDLVGLGQRMAERRQTLEAERSMEPFDTLAAMLMLPIRAAASAARAGAAAGRRSGASKSAGARSAGTRGTGSRATKSRATGTRTTSTRATSTRAATGTTRTAGATTRRATGAAGRTAAAAAGGRASASSGRKATTGRKAATGRASAARGASTAGSKRSQGEAGGRARADSGGRGASASGRARQAAGGRKGGSRSGTGGTGSSRAGGARKSRATR